MWICISLSFELHFINECLFMCILAIYILSLEGILFNFFGHYLNWIAFYFWIKIVSYIFWMQVPLWYIWSAKISFLFVGEFSFIDSIHWSTSLYFNEVQFISSAAACAFAVIYKKSLSNPWQRFYPYPSFKSFMVLVITFKYMTTFNYFLYI